MPELSQEKLRLMRSKHSPEIAEYLAKAAAKTQLITYGELAARFGGIARGFGDRLGGITLVCHERGYPKLPLIVVNASTRRPSEGAALYRDLGLRTSADVDREQQKCFKFDWSKADFS